MPAGLRLMRLFVALLTLVGVATPPVIEDHVESGFCSADCPIQHDGPTTSLVPPSTPRVTRRSAWVIIAAARRDDARVGGIHAPDAPRAPPSA
jgi:hypothetical protein